MNKLLLFIILIFAGFTGFAQHQADHWYFGNYAGLDFSSGKPEPVTEGQLITYEGCAAISDSLGNLLFYTDGVSVWNKENQIMENGTGLKGDSSSTQSSLIIPQPNNDGIYYIFTTDELSVHTKYLTTDGLNYSIVNINENNGNGKIIQKNIHLADSSTEKITAVKHQNNTDYWIITHEWGSDKYIARLLDETGLNETPVISSIGTNLSNDQRMSVGYMKASPDGSKIATAIWLLSKWEIFDFDNSTGSLSNKIEINYTDLYSAYSCEFSPDASKLYFSKYDTVFQADMNAGTQTDIQNSVTEIGLLNSAVGAIQNANNGKMYITSDFADSLCVINNPDSLPATCGFEKNGIYLDGTKARLGLPNFVQSYFKETSFRAENTCFGDSSIFTIKNIENIDSVEWNFDDPNSGTANTSKLINPKHRFTIYGLFKVRLTVWYNNISNNYYENIEIVPPPALNLGNDTVFCETDSYTLSAYSPHYSYLWNDLSTDSVLTINMNGSYSVDIENFYTGCKNSDTIQVVFSETPEIKLGNDTSFCEKTNFLIDAYHSGYSYTWQDGSHKSYYETDTAGIYFVHVKNAEGCSNSDTIKLKLILKPVFNLGNDTIICEGHYYTLSASIENTTYSWQDGSSDSIFFVSEPGLYFLKTENVCGSQTDTVYVDFEYCGPILIPNVITPNDDGVNDLFTIKGIENEAWSLSIYSRWGNLIFFSPDYKNDWSGAGIGSGVYYYCLINSDKNRHYNGTIRVIK